jgi:hypothetical protein
VWSNRIGELTRSETESRRFLEVKGHCAFRNFFSTYKRGHLIRHQNLSGILADIPLNSG